MSINESVTRRRVPRRSTSRTVGGATADGAKTVAAATVAVATAAAFFVPGSAATQEATTFRGGPAHSGVYESPPVAHVGGIEWRFQTDGPVRSSPVIAGGTLYIGSGDGHLYALDAGTGELRWKVDAGAAVTATPTVAGGRVFFQNRIGTLFAVDWESGTTRWKVRTGAELPFPWGHESGDMFTASPVVAGDLVLFGGGDGGVYALEARTGRVRWRYATGGRVRSTPAVAGGVVVAGSMDGRVHFIDLESGAGLRRFETEGASLYSGDFGFDRRSIQSSPAIADGAVYVGGKDGYLYAVGLGDAAERWRFDHEVSWVIGSPAVRDGVVYVGTSDGRFVQAVDADSGAQIWRFDTPSSVWSSPALAGDHLYVVDNAGWLFALDTRTGGERWRFRVPGGGRSLSSPLPHGGRLYLGSDDGAVYALRAAETPVRRAVYWDEELAPLGSYRRHEALRDHLAARGYEVVDAAGLADFLRQGIATRAAGVVVSAEDRLPAALVPGAADGDLLRHYLEAGGKLVWVGTPPLLARVDAETGSLGSLLNLNWQGPRELLGVDHGAAIFDPYGAWPTEVGRRWGLTGRLRGRWSATPDASLQVLARDENGLALAWVKGYGGPPGTGFVRLPADTPPFPSLDTVYVIAEYRPSRR